MGGKSSAQRQEAASKVWRDVSEPTVRRMLRGHETAHGHALKITVAGPPGKLTYAPLQTVHVRMGRATPSRVRRELQREAWRHIVPATDIVQQWTKRVEDWALLARATGNVGGFWDEWYLYVHQARAALLERIREAAVAPCKKFPDRVEAISTRADQGLVPWNTAITRDLWPASVQLCTQLWQTRSRNITRLLSRYLPDGDVVPYLASTDPRTGYFHNRKNEMYDWPHSADSGTGQSPLTLLSAVTMLHRAVNKTARAELIEQVQKKTIRDRVELEQCIAAHIKVHEVLRANLETHIAPSLLCHPPKHANRYPESLVNLAEAFVQKLGNRAPRANEVKSWVRLATAKFIKTLSPVITQAGQDGCMQLQ